VVTDLDGGPVRTGTEDPTGAGGLLAAADAATHAELLALIRD
jgi:hypothetical protein